MPAGPYRSAAPRPPSDQQLPAKFTDIRTVLDERLSPGSFINVIGLVKDCQLPIPTRKDDYKCTLKLFDVSIEDENDTLLCNIFRPEADMPEVSSADVVVLTSVRVQRFRNEPLSLITNRSSSIRVYKASKIPRPPRSAQIALQAGGRQDTYAPTDEEHRYVSYIYHKIDKYSVPDELEFQERAARSLNVKDKFSLLKDVQEGKFYDLIAQVAKDPFGFDMVTLYVSDYTEHPDFHPQIWQGFSEAGIAGDDPYGYTSGNIDVPKKEWAGPYGKMSLQITCFEPHATIVREEVTAGQWLFLRNVQIKRGHDGQHLEGFMREERNGASTKINVEVLEVTDRETIDPRLKEAIRRCRDYNIKKKKQIKEIKAAQAAGLKRKASANSEQDRPPNSKQRRKQKRALRQEYESDAVNEQLHLGLNDQVTCEMHKAPYSTIGSILEPARYERSPDAVYVLPFICAKYQTHARVVDFFPPSLEDFACSRKQTEYEILSDNEDDSDYHSSSSDDDEADGNARRIWEWRFALQLEDAAAVDNAAKKPGTAPRIWVFVDNHEAQGMTNLDAADLRRDPDTLNQLRERMFTLWGDLEEIKIKAAEQRKEGEEKGKKRHTRPGGKPMMRLEKPDLESSDGEGEGKDKRGAENKEKTVSNKPFSCCIKQYGVFDKDRGKEGEWVRCFGLFGTKIRY
ncbi:hypothetical protein VTI74DRAFT_7802 [Chaetomium olivicolor]